MDCIIRIAKTKALISCSVTAQLIWDFVFAYAKIRFSHTEAQFIKAILYFDIFFLCLLFSLSVFGLFGLLCCKINAV